MTVAAIIEKQGKFLLVEEHTAEGLRLNNPAGHLDPGESPQQACAREALEETTHEFTPTELVGVYLSRFQRESTGEDITYLRFAYCGELGDVQIGRELALQATIVEGLGVSSGGSALQATIVEGDRRASCRERVSSPV